VRGEDVGVSSTAPPPLPTTTTTRPLPTSACLWVAGDQDATSLELAFSKKKIEERKAWLQSFTAGTFLDQSADEITYSDFVDKVNRSTSPGKGGWGFHPSC